MFVRTANLLLVSCLTGKVGQGFREKVQKRAWPDQQDLYRKDKQCADQPPVLSDRLERDASAQHRAKPPSAKTSCAQAASSRRLGCIARMLISILYIYTYIYI